MNSKNVATILNNKAFVRKIEGGYSWEIFISCGVYLNGSNDNYQDAKMSAIQNLYLQTLGDNSLLSDDAKAFCRSKVEGGGAVRGGRV